MTRLPAGWYNDPYVPGGERFHDGVAWTDQARLREGAHRVPAAPRGRGRGVALLAVVALVAVGVGAWALLRGDDGTEPVGAPIPCEPLAGGVDSVLVGTPWAMGVRRELELTERRRDPADPSSEAAATTPVSVTVVGREPDGWALTWEGGATSFAELGAAMSVEEQAELADLVDDLPSKRIDYRVDDAGELLGVDNPEELRASIVASIELVAETLAAGDAAVEATRALVSEMPDAALVALAAEPIELLHAFSGVELVEGSPVEFETELSNTFGGDPFPAHARVEIADLRDRDGCVALEVRVTPDAEQFGPLLIDSLRRITPGLDDATADELEQVARTRIEHVMSGQLDAGSGWFRTLRLRKEIVGVGSERIDELTLTDRTSG